MLYEYVRVRTQFCGSKIFIVVDESEYFGRTPRTCIPRPTYKIYNDPRRDARHDTACHFCAFNKQKKQFDYIKSSPWYSPSRARTTVTIRFLPMKLYPATFFHLTRFSVLLFLMHLIKFSYPYCKHIQFFPFAFPFHFHSRNERCRWRCMKWASFHLTCVMFNTWDEIHVRLPNECNSSCNFIIYCCIAVCVLYDSRWSCGEILRSHSRRR